MKPKIIMHTQISLDGRIKGFDNPEVYYQVAGGQTAARNPRPPGPILFLLHLKNILLKQRLILRKS